MVGEPAVNVNVLTVAALAGTIDSKPKPIAATVPSAIRLKDFLVDICFLSFYHDKDSLHLDLTRTAKAITYVAFAPCSGLYPLQETCTSARAVISF
jgi:hypothetical protein